MINVSMFFLSDSRLRVTIHRGPQLTISQDVIHSLLRVHLPAPVKELELVGPEMMELLFLFSLLSKSGLLYTGRLSRLSITRATNNVARHGYTCTGTLSG